MLQKYRGRLVFSLLCSGLWLAQTAPATAQAADARSVSLGGATAASAKGTAYAPLYNPAAMGGNWTLMLPGASLSAGNNVLGVGEIAGLAGNLNDVLGTVTDLTGRIKLQDGLRLEAAARVPLIGYTGKPLPVSVLGQPIHVGVNLWGQGGANIMLSGSQGLGGMISGASSLGTDIGRLQSAASSLPTQLSSSINELNSALATFQNTDTSNPQALSNALGTAITAAENLNGTLNGALSPLQTATSSLSSALGPIGSEAQFLNASVVADGHLTLAFSGKTAVYRNDLVNVSVGANLKSFIMPSVATIPDPLGVISGNQSATMKVPPVALNARLDTQPMAGVASIANTLASASTTMDSAKTGLNQILTTARTAQSQAGLAANGDQAAAAQLAGTMQNLAADASALGTSISGIQGTIGGLAGIQQSLMQDLQKVTLQTSSFSEVSPVGFGADLGVLAEFGDEWTAGAALENALVVWPGTEQVTTYTLSSFNGPTPAFATSGTESRSANYDRSEPRALRIGGTYQPKAINGLTVAGDLEAVFNGRPLALHLGAEYRVARILGLRLGTQIGGLGTMITPGIGVNLGGFNLDLAGGFDFSGRAFQAATGMSAAF